jgi:hypothetical protein
VRSKICTAAGVTVTSMPGSTPPPLAVGRCSLPIASSTWLTTTVLNPCRRSKRARSLLGVGDEAGPAATGGVASHHDTAATARPPASTRARAGI